MKHIIFILFTALLFEACGQSYEETKRQTKAERMQRQREDSAALKIAVMPTLDCLPLYVAQSYNLFDSLGADIRLKPFMAQSDCDTALMGGSVEGGITDLVRGQRIEAKGTPLTYVAATNTYWQLITNRNARISGLKQLNDKMVAMTRYSATDLLADYAIDSVKLDRNHVFKVQINDVTVRLDMICNNEMDAMLLTEPQAAVARQQKHKVVMDSRKLNLRLGTIAFRSKIMADKERKRQLDIFVKAYNMACDSISKNGLEHYADIVADYCHVRREIVDGLGREIKFVHAKAPRKEDMDRAGKWLKQAK